MLDAGCWMLDAGCWILDAGCWMLDAGCWILDAGCWMLDAGCWMLDAGYWILYWILDAGISSIKYPVSSIFFRSYLTNSFPENLSFGESRIRKYAPFCSELTSIGSEIFLR